jgi:drug/metabolite transporter (DMT)-like permease
MIKNYLLILLTVCISVTAQTMLKTGMNQIGKLEISELSLVLPMIIRMGTNIFVILGLSLYVAGTFFWLVLLSRLDLSFLYPFGALQYLLIFIVSYFLLGEEIKLARIIGVFVVMLGIFIIGKWG